MEGEQADTDDIFVSDDEDWADNSSVTTDDEPSDPPAKKNIHARRCWKLIPKGESTFVIEGGRKPKEIRMLSRSEMFEDEKHLAEADFILFVFSPPPPPKKAKLWLFPHDYAHRA
jgi:hypothetical protein